MSLSARLLRRVTKCQHDLFRIEPIPAPDLEGRNFTVISPPDNRRGNIQASWQYRAASWYICVLQLLGTVPPLPAVLRSSFGPFSSIVIPGSSPTASMPAGKLAPIVRLAIVRIPGGSASFGMGSTPQLNLAQNSGILSMRLHGRLPPNFVPAQFLQDLVAGRKGDSAARRRGQCFPPAAHSRNDGRGGQGPSRY